MNKTRTSLLLLICFLLWKASAFATPLQVDLFLTTSCPLCKQAQIYFNTLEKKYPINVNTYWIDQNPKTLQLFYQKLKTTGYTYFNIPAYFFCGTHWIGISKTVQSQIPLAIQYCLTEQKKGTDPHFIAKNLTHWAEGTYYHIPFIPHLWPPFATIILGLLDALNPCALFYIFNFIALMVLQTSRKNTISIGLGWILSLGLLHAFQTLLPNAMDTLVSHYFIPSLIAGLLSIGVSIALHSKRKLPLSFMLLVSLWISAAIALNQQTCIPKMNMIFYAYWMGQPAKSIVLPILYLMAYLLLPLLFIAFSLKIQRYHPRIHQAALCMLLITGVLLVIAPQALSSFLLSCIVLLISLGLGWHFRRTSQSL